MAARRRRIPIGTILFVLFASFTLLEIWLIFLLAKWTNWPFTIGLAIVSALVGSAMAKHQGLTVLQHARQELSAGRFPAQSLADGVMILIGGAFLITPGLFTDLSGFSTLVPAIRRVYARLVMRWAAICRAGFIRKSPPPGVFDAGPGSYAHSEAADGEPIDVEFKRTE